MLMSPAPVTALRCLAFIAVGVFAVALRAQPTDADFLAAREAFLASDAAVLDRIAPRAKGHLLEPYITYWQLRLKLDEATPRPVAAEFNGERIVGRLWPAANNDVVVLELTY